MHAGLTILITSADLFVLKTILEKMLNIRIISWEFFSAQNSQFVIFDSFWFKGN